MPNPDLIVHVPNGYIIAECLQNRSISTFYVPVGYAAVAFIQSGLNQKKSTLKTGAYQTSGRHNNICGRNESITGIYGYTLARLSFDIGFTDIQIGDKKYGFNGTLAFRLGEDNRTWALIDSLTERDLVTVEDIRTAYFNFLVDDGAKIFAKNFTGNNKNDVANLIKESLREKGLLHAVGIEIIDFVINRVISGQENASPTPPPQPPKPAPKRFPAICPICGTPVPPNNNGSDSCAVCGNNFIK